MLFKSIRSRKTNNKILSTTLAHDAYFNNLRDTEYKRLSEQGHVYLDYTGGNLYGISQIKFHNEILSSSVFGNPHSTNPSSQFATKLVEDARNKVLEFFNAEDYFCVFTANASGALKIVGECYPFSAESELLLFSDNHNSVNGIREYCEKRGGEYTYVPVHYEDLKIDERVLSEKLHAFDEKKNKLFAFPGQSNASGVKHDLGWVKKAQDKGWDVLLDAAAYAPTNRIDLKQISPDFVSISFYKIFGYPTGIGCLLVKKSKFDVLDKQWFAGGTISLVSVGEPNHFLLDNHERFENGTLNYLDIPSIKNGLEYIEEIGMGRINERVNSLIKYLYQELKELKHDSGVQQLNLLGPEDRNETGGNLIMTFCNPDESLIPFDLIEAKANEKMISIRSGCFCNPGIDEANHCATTEELKDYFTSRDHGNYFEMTSYLNKLRGSTRVSVGLATTKADIDTFVDFVKSLKNKSFSDQKSVMH